ncbi:MAG: helix-turn-helix transcriptional regulator [Neglectibacter timonensis]
MQISRLFEIVYLLLERRSVTARELAERFEVSPRTIYRDVDALAQAGIPVYADRGQGGGIRLMEQFVLNKSLLSVKERRELLASVQGMQAVREEEVQPLLEKLSSLFGAEREDWIEVDFSPWTSSGELGKYFQLLKEAILNRQVVCFSYSAANGSTVERTAEPHRLFFRGYDWYLLAWCRIRSDFRYFKLTRMRGLATLPEHFEKRNIPERESAYEQPDSQIELTVRASPRMAYRVYDEFPPDFWEKEENGSFLIRFAMPQNEWLYSYLLGYGPELEVIAPPQVREELLERAEKNLKNYKS